jgi:hypothetical protein
MKNGGKKYTSFVPYSVSFTQYGSKPAPFLYCVIVLLSMCLKSATGQNKCLRVVYSTSQVVQLNLMHLCNSKQTQYKHILFISCDELPYNRTNYTYLKTKLFEVAPPVPYVVPPRGANSLLGMVANHSGRGEGKRRRGKRRGEGIEQEGVHTLAYVSVLRCVRIPTPFVRLCLRNCAEGYARGNMGCGGKQTPTWG